MIFWSAISLLVICGVFISPRSQEAGVWVIERWCSGPDESFPCWISTDRKRTGLVTFSMVDAQIFFCEADAQREIEKLSLSSVWSAVEKGGSS
jgi:hypothetical protein